MPRSPMNHLSRGRQAAGPNDSSQAGGVQQNRVASKGAMHWPLVGSAGRGGKRLAHVSCYMEGKSGCQIIGKDAVDIEGGKESTGVGIGYSYRRLVQEQRSELEELKRAAREASPSSNSQYPPREVSIFQPPPLASGGESQRPPLLSPPGASQTPAAGRDESQRLYAGVGVGGDFLAAVTTRGRKAEPSSGVAGLGPDGGSTGDGDGGKSILFHDSLASGPRFGTDYRSGSAANGVYFGYDVAAGNSRGDGEDIAARARETGAGSGLFDRKWADDGNPPICWQGDQQRPELLLKRRDYFKTGDVAAGSKGEAGGAALEAALRQRYADNAAVRFAPREDGGKSFCRSSPAGASAIADEALASLGVGGACRVSDAATRVANGAIQGGRASNRSLLPPDSGSGYVGRTAARDDTGESNSVQPPPPPHSPLPPPPLQTSPTAFEPSHTAFDSRSRIPPFADSGVTLAGFNGCQDRSEGSCREAKGLAPAAGADERSPPEGGVVGTTRSHLGSSPGAVGINRGTDGGSFHQGGFAADRRTRGAGGEAKGVEWKSFQSASWAEKLVIKREEQSVLVRQLERELASTVSALKDERRERRAQTEALKSKLDEARAAAHDRDAELERRERMTTTLMGELEALRTRCDRLSASREERAEEADKSIARLREDNRELEARLRQADAAAAEARSARAGADAERIRLERDLHSAMEKMKSVERSAQVEAEAAAAAAEEAARELRESKQGQESLSSELNILRRRMEEERERDYGGSLRAQVADLERLLQAANQRCVDLEARLALLEEELKEAEGGEVEARARLRWALGQLGDAPITAAAATTAVDDAAGAAGSERGHRARENEHLGESSPRNGTVVNAKPTQTAPREEGPTDPQPGSQSLPGRQYSSLGTAGRGPGSATSLLAERDFESRSVSRNGLLVGRPCTRALVPSTAAPSAGTVDREKGETAEKMRLEEYREPDWRSMVPALFPPGWRDHQPDAASSEWAESTIREGRGLCPTASTVAAAAAAADVDADPGTMESNACRESDSMPSARPSGLEHAKTRSVRGERIGMERVVDGRGEATSSLEDDRGFGMRDGESTGGGSVDVSVNSPGTSRTQAATERLGAGEVTTAERVQTAVDQLPVAERRFAYTGGVEREYEYCQSGESDENGGEFDGFENEADTGATREGADEGDTSPFPTSGHALLSSREPQRDIVGGRTSPRGPSRKRERQNAAIARTSRQVAGLQSAVRSRPQEANAPRMSSPVVRSKGRSGHRLHLRVPGPRNSGTVPVSRPTRRRPPSHPQSANTGIHLSNLSSVVSNRRAASLSLSTVTPSRTSTGGSNVVGSGPGRGNGPVLRYSGPRYRESESPATFSRGQTQPAAALPAGVRRRSGRGSAVERANGVASLPIDLSRSTPGRPPTGRRVPGSSGSGTGRSTRKCRVASVDGSDIIRRSTRNSGGEAKPGWVADTATPTRRSASSVLGGGYARIGTRAHVSLMRRRKEKEGLRTGGVNARRSGRNGSRLGGGVGNSSTCSSVSRAWRP